MVKLAQLPPSLGLVELQDEPKERTCGALKPDNGRVLIFHGDHHRRGVRISDDPWTPGGDGRKEQGPRPRQKGRSGHRWLWEPMTDPQDPTPKN
eukprot:11945845-Alexandrium_andersonii.AAC.1